MAVKNFDIASGGVSRHIEPDSMRLAAERESHFVSISPLRTDFPDEAKAKRLPIRPDTDTALMLAIMHVLDAEGLADTGFLASHCVGYETLVPLFATPTVWRRRPGRICVSYRFGV